jgi:peptidoglycan/LPS O-acetylase OafA/YrhL
LIDGAARGFRGAGKIVLEWRPVLYLGKISYSLYLFHYFVPFLFSRFGIPQPHSWAPKFMLFAAVTIAAASVSWYGFERPINGLKRYFTYGRSRGTQPAPQPAKVALPAKSVVIAAEVR